MPDTKISALPAATTPLAGTEQVPIVQGGETRRVSASEFNSGGGDMLAANNLSDLADAATARDNLGVPSDAEVAAAIAAAAYTDAQARAAIHAAPTVISGTSHTATLANSYGYLSFTNGSAITFTIPPQASVAWADGVTIAWEQSGAGVITITAGAGVTINSRGGLVASAGQFAVGQLKRTALNTWTLIGDVA
jgi:hypothetical protein